MNKNEFINNLNIDKTLADLTGFNPYFKPVQSGLGKYIQIDGKKLLCLGSNDYLGLGNNNTIKEEAIKILKGYGLSLCGTPIVIGHTDINRHLEKRLANFLKQEDALLFPSCYQCNMGIFMILAGKEDLVIADKEVHSSLLNGIALSRCPVRFFPHNNLNVLERLLNKSTNKRMRFVVLEGLYSTHGDVPVLDKIIDLAEQYNAFIIVDDAHGVGVLGKDGRGILEIYNAYNNIGIITGSLGKAIGTFGGFLAGKEKTVDYFRCSSPMFFYSTALPPAISAATIAALKLIENYSDIRDKINKLAQRLQAGLKSIGYYTTSSSTPLVSVILKSEKDTILMAKMLFEKGVYVVPFIPPSVPKRSPRIRMTINAYLCERDIDFTLEIFNEIKKIN